MEDCRLYYPAFARRLNEPGYKEDRACARLEGEDHTVRRCLVAWSSTDGLKLTGKANTVEDCLVHDVSWDGSLSHVAYRTEQPRQGG